jgi:hypothetical protein
VSTTGYVREVVLGDDEDSVPDNRSASTDLGCVVTVPTRAVKRTRKRNEAINFQPIETALRFILAYSFVDLMP